MRVVSPPRPVEVLRDDHWWPGELRAWIRYEDTWWADVMYSVGVGMRHVQVVAGDRVRPVLTR